VEEGGNAMNYMKRIALMLGLEWDEEKGESSEFYVNCYAHKHKFTKKSLRIKDSDGVWVSSCINFNMLFNNGIKLPPWKPKMNELYYFADISYPESVNAARWSDHEIDKHRLNHDLICRTPEGCVIRAKEIIKMLECANGESV
jgi:hypothetical protein